MEGGLWFSPGIFFKPLAEEFAWSRAQTSIAYTLFLLGYGVSGFVMGRLADRYGPRRVMAPAAAMVGLGLVLSSRIGGWGELLLTYALIGVGLGPTWIVPATTIQRWFIKHRGLTLGLVLSGVGLGALIYAPLINWLISSYGWRTAFVITGLVSGAGFGVAALVMLPSPEQRGLKPYGWQEAMASPTDFPTWSKRDLTTPQALRTGAFWWLLLVTVLGQMPIMFLTMHLVPYITDQGMSGAVAAGAVGILGGVSIPGRLLIGGVADRIGWKLSFALANFGAAAAVMAMVAIANPLAAYLIIGIYGFFHGARVPPTAGLMSFLFGTRSLNELIGIHLGGSILVSAFAPVVGGLLFDRMGNYQIVLVLSAASFALGGCLLYFLRPPTTEG